MHFLLNTVLHIPVLAPQDHSEGHCTVLLETQILLMIMRKVLWYIAEYVKGHTLIYLYCILYNQFPYSFHAEKHRSAL